MSRSRRATPQSLLNDHGQVEGQGIEQEGYGSSVEAEGAGPVQERSRQGDGYSQEEEGFLRGEHGSPPERRGQEKRDRGHRGEARRREDAEVEHGELDAAAAEEQSTEAEAVLWPWPPAAGYDPEGDAGHKGEGEPLEEEDGVV